MDEINGIWELAGAFATGLSCYRAWREKCIRGVSAWTILFFLSWGLWNCAFYPAQGLPYSFAGGMAMMVTNVLWGCMWLRYHYVRGPN